jgi:hypothetical protein
MMAYIKDLKKNTKKPPHISYIKDLNNGNFPVGPWFHSNIRDEI